jgi:hypothetical protein
MSRTTRMLEHATELSRKGEHVAIVMATQEEADRVKSLLDFDPRIYVVSASVREFDWVHHELIGMWDRRCFVDHRVDELLYERSLRVQKIND